MKRTSSKTANNAKYCMKYRNKNIETIREKDKERKRFEREYEKYCDEEKYEEKMYVRGEEWLKCPVCCQWYHEDCFYV